MFGTVLLNCPQGPPRSTTCKFDNANLKVEAGGSNSTRVVYTVDPEQAPSSGNTYPISAWWSYWPQGSISHTYWVSLTVPNFNMHPCSTEGTIGPGGYTQAGECRFFGSGWFTGPITVSCRGLPAGTQCEFTENTVTLAPTTEHYSTGSVSFLVRSTLPKGTYTFEVVAEGGNIRRISPYTLTVP